jgi:hypothetical protein
VVPSVAAAGGKRRLTAPQAVKSGPSGVTGASEWMASGTPLASAVAQAFMRIARSGPTVVS